jgi:hypothetical protein
MIPKKAREENTGSFSHLGYSDENDGVSGFVL